MEIKSSSVESSKKYILDKFGNDGYERWLNSLPEKSQVIFRGMIHSTPWYPIQDGMVQPTIVTAQLFFNNDVNKAAREMGRYSSDRAFTGLYKLLARLASPETFIERGVKILNDYYRGMTCKIIELQKGHWMLQLHGFTEPMPVVEQRTVSWLETALTKCSAKNLKMAITRTSSGRPTDYTEIEATWSV